MAHTPGPWKVFSGDHGSTVVAWLGGIQVAWCGTAGSYGAESYRLGIEEARSNAKLIAAAPDLLKALRELVECYAGGGFMEPDADVLDAARAAIARAEGK